MNFQQIQYVLAVHEQKHFGKAADYCNVTQATLSAMVKKIEEELGVVLFDRSRKPIKTTDAGLEFLAIGRDIINKKNELFTIKKDAKNLVGNLRIGIIPTVANSLLPLILPTILNENPNLKLDIREITTDEIKEQLKLDKIDLGILATPINNKKFEEHILYYESLMVYGIETLHNKNYISSDDVKNNKIWLLEEGHCFREQSITICKIKQKKEEYNNLTFKGSSFETLLSLTDTFGGFTLIPELYYTNLSDEKKNKVKQFNKPIPVREISLLTYRQHAKNKTVNYLTKLIQDKVKSRLITSNTPNKDLDIVGV